MAFSLLLLLFIYYPLIRLYFFPQKPDLNLMQSDFYIEIPKINVLSEIVENVDPFNEAVYRRELEKGVAHAKGTAFPDENGKMYLFAHSSDLPWRITKYNVTFFRLSELKKGDFITIGRKGRIYKYQVVDEKTVWPSDVSHLLEAKNKQLILQTCTPIGTSLKRLLIFAQPIL